VAAARKIGAHGILEDGKECDMWLQERRKKMDNRVAVKDLLDLYEYGIGLSEKFPRNVLSKASTYYDIKKIPGKKENTSTVTGDNDTNDHNNPKRRNDMLLHLIDRIEIKSAVAEQAKKIKLLEEDVEKGKGKCTLLEQELKTISEVVLQLQAFLDVAMADSNQPNVTSKDTNMCHTSRNPSKTNQLIVVFNITRLQHGRMLLLRQY
jgi:hypothetical protein